MKTTIGKFITAGMMCFALMANAETVTPSDAEIFGILAAANTGEIQAAEIAAQKATHPEIKGFAQQMQTEHTTMNKESTALAGKLGLKSKESATSKMLTKKSQADLKKLRELKGAEFEEEYIGDQVLMHKLVLETIENVLIKSADNPELKTLLTQAQGKVAAHLDHARQLDKKYDK
jgi:putative membrane protein